MKKNTYFIDIDGTIFMYRNFNNYHSEPAQTIKASKQYLQQIWDNGHYIVLTTARPEELRTLTEKELRINNIPYSQLVMGIERGPRFLINDMEFSSNKKRAFAINVKRDKGITTGNKKF